MIITAAGLLVKGKNILLGKRQRDREYYPNVWDLIGGRCEKGETPEQALVRELQEEIGVTPRNFKYIRSLGDQNAPDEYEYRIYFVYEWEGEPGNLQLHEHSEIRWFTVNEAVLLDLADSSYPELFQLAVPMTDGN